MTKKSISLSSFYNEYGKELDNRRAALFIGAGMSVEAGFPTWSDLLRDTATELELDIDKETDLVSLAQFYFNEKNGRNRLNQLIVDFYDKEDIPITENHRLLASLPIETVWTTNYDRLIEKGFCEVGKLCDVRVTKANFSSSPRGRDVIVYKMHGDVKNPQNATLTKNDYEVYSLEHEIFFTALKGDLVTKTFLFLGFSFTDPNIDYILSRIRLLMGETTKQHYCVMRWPEKPKSGDKEKAQYDYDMVRLHLRISDLKRYGIQALMIDEYTEITDILETLNKRANRNNIFVSGSAYTYEPMGQQRIEEFASLLGQQTIRQDFNLVSGVGLGIGGIVLLGAVEEVYSAGVALTDRVIMRPFPRLASHPSSKELKNKYRQDMLSSVGYIIFLCGNKLDRSTGKNRSATGVREEFRISQELGIVPIPVGATGGVAKEIWEEVMVSPKKFYPGINVDGHLQLLGDINKTNEELVDAIFAIINLVGGR